MMAGAVMQGEQMAKAGGRGHGMLRCRLMWGTALAAACVLMAPGARAQGISGNIVGILATNGSTVVSNGATSTTVNTTANAMVLNWDAFNVASGHSVAFNGTNGTPQTIVNRVIGSYADGTYAGVGSVTPSAIAGSITSTPNTTVWLINPAGIAFSSTGSFSGGSLVLSTLNTSDSAILNGTSQSFANPLGSGAVTLANGSSISANNVLVMGDPVQVGGGINASGNVALIAAKGVTFPSSVGSPLSYSITSGSTVGGVELLGTASVSGANVTVGALSQAGAVSNLLQVDNGAALTATSDGGVVTLATTADGTATGASHGDTISLAGGGITTTGANGSIHVLGAAGLAADTTLTPSGTGKALFSSTLDGAHALRVDGNAEFDGAVGGGASLISLGVGGSTLLKGGLVNTSFVQSYNGPVTLGANTRLAGDVGFIDTLDGAYALTLTGSAAFYSAVGSLQPLTSLDVGTVSYINSPITTTGAQTYRGAVWANAVLTGSTITFGSALDGIPIVGNLPESALKIVGNAVFGGAVGSNPSVPGNNNQFASFEVTGTTALNGGSLTTQGAVALDGAVSLGANTSIAGTSIAFGSMVDGAGQALSVNAGNGAVSVAGQMGGAGALGAVSLTGGAIALAGVDAASLSLANSGTLTLNGGDYTIASPTPYVFGDATTNGMLRLGQNTHFGAVTLGSDTTLRVSNVVFGGTVNGAHSLSIENSAEFDGAVGAGTALTNLNVGLYSTINGGYVKTTGSQVYYLPVVLGADTTLAGSTIWAASIDGAGKALSVTASGSDGIWAGRVGSPGAPLGAVSFSAPIVGLEGLDAAQLTMNNVGLIHLNTGDYTIASGQLAFGDTVAFGDLTLGQATSFNSLRLGSDVTLNSSSVNGAISIGAITQQSSGLQLGVNAGSASITGSGQWGLTRQPLGAVSLTGGAITLAGVDTASLSLANSGTLTLNGGDYTIASPTPYVFGPASTNGTLTLGQDTRFGPLTLASDTTLAGATTTTLDAVDGAHSLTIAGNAVFNGAIGSATALTSLNSGAAALNGGSVTTSGSQTYSGAVTLGSDTTLTGSTLIFNSTVDGAHSLKGNGLVEFYGAVGANTKLTSLWLTGQSYLDGSAISTTGTQRFDSLASISNSDLTLNASAAIFNASVKSFPGSTYGLTVNGAAAFNAPIAITGRLLSFLTVNGSASLSGGLVSTSGAQTYNGVVTLGANETLSASTVRFGNAIDGARALDIVGDAVFAWGGVGQTTPLTSLGVSGTTAFNGGGIATSGAQTYSGAVTLNGSTWLTASKATFGSTIDGGNPLAITGNAEFDGAVGGSAPLFGLWVSGTSLIKGGLISTLEDQTYVGAARLGSDTLFVSASPSGGGITFGSTLDSDSTPRNVNIQSADLVSFGGSVGGSSPLQTLVVASGSTITDTGAADSLHTLGSMSFDAPGQIALAGLSAAGATSDILIDQATTTPGTVSVAGNVSAGRNYAVSGASVQLGGAGAVAQSAGNGLSITATSGDVTQGAGPLALTSDTNGNGSALSVAGDNVVLGNATLLGGASGTSAPVVITGQAITTGTLGGSSVAVTAGGGVTLGAVNAVNTAHVVAGGAMAVNGAVTAGGAITLIDSGAGIALGDGGSLSSSGDAVLVAANGAFANGSSSGARAISAGNGHYWTVYTQNTAAPTAAPAANSYGGLAGSNWYNDAYNFTTGSFATAVPTGNRFVTPYQATLTVTYTADAASSTYGATVGSLSGAYATSPLAYGDSLSGVANWSTAATSASHVGSYAIDGAGIGSANNALVTTVQAAANASALTITPRALTITYTSAPASSTYGTSPSGLTGTTSSSGLVNGDVLRGTALWSTPATSSSPAGAYAIIGSGLSGGSNYLTSSVQAAGNAGALTITTPPASIRVVDEYYTLIAQMQAAAAPAAVNPWQPGNPFEGLSFDIAPSGLVCGAGQAGC